MLVVGVTVTKEPVVELGSQVYVAAPLDDNVNVVSAHTVDDDEPAVTVGVIPTDKFNV